MIDCRAGNGASGRCRKAVERIGLEKTVSSTKGPFQRRKTPSKVGNVAQSFCTSCSSLQCTGRLAKLRAMNGDVIAFLPRPLNDKETSMQNSVRSRNC